MGLRLLLPVGGGGTVPQLRVAAHTHCTPVGDGARRTAPQVGVRAILLIPSGGSYQSFCPNYFQVPTDLGSVNPRLWTLALPAVNQSCHVRPLLLFSQGRLVHLAPRTVASGQVLSTPFFLVNWLEHPHTRSEN